MIILRMCSTPCTVGPWSRSLHAFDFFLIYCNATVRYYNLGLTLPTDNDEI